MAPKEAFFSHSSVDLLFARNVVEVLRAHGVRTWHADEEIRGAQQWHDEIGRALKRCDWFMVLLSPDAVVATWVKRELVYALDQERYSGRILPLVYRPCAVDKLSWVLSGMQMVDLSGDFDAGCRELLATWGIAWTSK